MKKLLPAIALLLSIGSAWADPIYPPPPVPAADCAGGASVTGYPAPGAPIGAGGHCGATVSTGTLNTGLVGQLGEYSGTGTISGITPGGDVTFTSPNFLVTGLKGVALGSTTATAGNLLIGSGTQWVTHALSGDGTLSSAGALTVNSIGGQAATLAGPFTTAGAFSLTLTQTAATSVTLPTTGTLASQTYVQAQGFTLGSTPIIDNGATYATIAGLTLSAPTITGNASFGSGLTLTAFPSAPLLGTDSTGSVRAITLGTGLSLSGTTLMSTGGGGGGGFTPPASGTLLISNGTTAPNGLSEVDNAFLVGAGGAWTTLSSAANSVPCWSASSILLACSTSTMQTLLGYLTGNQTITLGGDASGSGATSITATNLKLNGVAYPASPASNTIPVVTSSNQVTYDSAAAVLSVLGAPFSVPNGGWGLATLTSGAIYKGNGTSAPSVSALADNGTFVTTSEPIDLTSQSTVIEVANASSTGTTNGLLAKLTGAPSTAVKTATTDTDGAVGVVVGGGGTTGSAQIAIAGQASCTFDGATTAGHYVQISSGTAGDCTDSGSATRPSGAQVIGRVLSTNASGGSYAVQLSIGFTNTAGSAPTWPTSGKIVVSNGTNTPAGITEVDGDCVIGSSGSWVAGTCLGGGAVTSAGTSTVNNIPFWTGTDTLSNTGVPYGTTGNNTLAETLGTGLLSNAIVNWAAPSAIGGTTPAAGAFTTLSASSTVSGTGFSTYLASPPAIGGTTPAAGAFTTLSASSTVSGTGFSTYLASPPAIGGTAAAAGAFTTLSASSTVSGTGFSTYLLSPPAIGTTAPAAGKFTTLTATGNLTTNVTGSTQCLHANSSGVVSGTASDCGTGTSIDTVTTGIAAAGTTLAAATDLTTNQNYVATGANCTTYPNCIGNAAVRIDAALMVAGQHIYVTNEDPSDAILVYPDTTGHTINNQAVGVGIAVQANQTALLIVKSATALRTVP